LRTASFATSSEVAATAATSAPAHWISVPGVAITRTAVTPLTFLASLTSMETTLACACGEVRSAPNSRPGLLVSEAYFARPVDFCKPSMRLIRLPIRRRCSCEGQVYSGIASSLHLSGGFEHGLPDTDVGAAAAEIAAQSLLYFRFVLRV